VSSYAFVNPVVAVVLGALFLNEHLTARQAIGATVIVLAVAGLLYRRRQTADASDITEQPLEQAERCT
jgi:drug/metabolite transporter (DMT)-like permease